MAFVGIGGCGIASTCWPRLRLEACGGACPQRKREAFGRSCGGGTAQYGGDGTAQSGGARLGRLVEKERRCERDAGAVGGQAGEKADGRAGEGGAAFRHGARHGE